MSMPQPTAPPPTPGHLSDFFDHEDYPYIRPSGCCVVGRGRGREEGRLRCLGLELDVDLEVDLHLDVQSWLALDLISIYCCCQTATVVL